MDWQGFATLGFLLCGVMVMVGRVLQTQKSQGKQLDEFCEHANKEISELWAKTSADGMRISKLEGYRNGQQSVDSSR